MLSQIYTYFTLETIYVWLNYTVIPLWIVLIFFPNSKINQLLISSIFIPLIFSIIYIYIKDLFTNDNFLIIFWVHFLAINLFLGSWVSRDAYKYSVPKFLSAITLIFIYFTGPLGIVLYWFIRIFYAKKVSLHD